MKKRPTWRLLLLIAGALLGLIAGLGVAAPANAANAYLNADNEVLSLGISRDGSYTVKGANYEGLVVEVWITKVSGRDRVVDHKQVRPGSDDAFTLRGWGLRCGETYQAVTYSPSDGWDKSGRERSSCRG